MTERRVKCRVWHAEPFVLADEKRCEEVGLGRIALCSHCGRKVEFRSAIWESFAAGLWSVST